MRWGGGVCPVVLFSARSYTVTLPVKKKPARKIAVPRRAEIMA